MKHHAKKAGKGRQRSKPSNAPDPTTVEALSPKWVASMQTHYQQTGYYRADDLNRLLGDPRESVSMLANESGAKLVSLVAK